MTRKVTVTEVRTRLLALLHEIEVGEAIEITRHGITVAQLAPPSRQHSLRGRCAGIASSTASDEALFTTGATWDMP